MTGRQLNAVSSKVTCILIAFILVLNSYNTVVTTQSVPEPVKVEFATSITEDLGPVITITCMFPFETFDRVQWFFYLETQGGSRPQVIFQGTSFTDDNLATRYDATDNGRNITIKNALQSDQGRYSCRVNFKNNTFKDSGATEVEVDYYLPDPEFLKCNLEPRTILYIVGSNATFTCNVGDSNPPVNVELILEKTIGSNENLSIESEVTWTITTDDNNATFVCIMSSHTFPTAPERRCTSGPISVQPLPMSSIIMTMATTVSTTSNIVTMTVPPVASNGDNQGAVIGGSIAAVIVILILILIGLFFVFPRIKKLKRTRTSDRSVARMVDMESKESSKPRPTISEPLGPVAFNRTSVDLDSTDTMNHDYAFTNDSVTEENTPPDVAKESSDHQTAVDLYPPMYEADENRKSKFNSRKIKGISKQRPEISAPFGQITVHQRLIDLPNSRNSTDLSIDKQHANENTIKPNGAIVSVHEQSSANENSSYTEDATKDVNRNDIPAYEREDAPSTEIDSSVPPIYGEINKDQAPIYGTVKKNRKKGRSDQQARRSTHVYQSADELEQSDDNSASQRPSSELKPPQFYDRVDKGSRDDLNVTGLDDNSGYASADDIDAHCRKPKANGSRDHLNVIGSSLDDNSGYASADEIDEHFRKRKTNGSRDNLDTIGSSLDNYSGYASADEIDEHFKNPTTKRSRDTLHMLGSRIEDNSGYASADEIDTQSRRPQSNTHSNIIGISDTEKADSEEPATSEPPVYSVVKKNATTRDKDKPDEAETSEPSRGEDDELGDLEAPVYSEVKKRPKGDKRTSGFVDNVIYLSSDRKSKVESDA